MGSVLEPNGPLPPEIYWRRRALAIGASVVALILFVWIVTSLGGGDDDPSAEAAAASSSQSSTSSGQAAPSSAGDGGGSGSGSGSGEASASGSGSGGSGGGSSVSGSVSGEAAASSSAVVPAGQCPDQSLAIKASSNQPNYPAGQEPQFGIVVTNIGSATCERDLGAGMQQVLVYSLDGQQRIWSNTDCFPNTAPDIRSLKPGEQAAFTVKWSGATSEPGCTAPRNPVGPGAYTVVGQLGALRSTPEPFNIS
ncbi:hypothetical protein SAMN05444583_10221 [Rhodococcus maanshanensis]|uniref:DUF4232 domain-containing protein n=1 Tax=Rhodococcus maanshanensis TaxID=183556 RepID=A0A1H7H6P5_9NOCA|nr:hypothetical protein SAMN05444583_10221 [Rhodococcus maanshanensis]